MRIKRFDNFLLESQLIYKGDFKKMLYDIKQEYWNQPESDVANFLLDLAGMELDLVHNYIKDVVTPGLVSFIPEDKINFNRCSIEQSKIVTKSNIVKAYGIPTEGLITLREDILQIGNDDFPNDFKLIKTIDTDVDPLSDESLRLFGYYLYYLQSNTYPEKFVVVFRLANDKNETQSIYPYDLPENRRSEVKIGRFVNKIIDIYKKSGLEDYTQDENGEKISSKLTASDIEKFVNAYTSKVLFNQDALQRFELVKGDEIKKWYHESNYASKSNSGPLHNSCMRFGRCQGFFKIYIDNPDVCQLLILKDETGKKIDGRALIWTTVDGKRFMDRIYVNKDSYTNLFKKWADENQCLVKVHGYGYGYGPGFDPEFIVKVQPKLYSTYPYMDTLDCYIPDKGILTNDVNIDMLQKYPDIRKKTRIEDFKKFFARKKSGSAHFRVDGKDIVIFRLKSTSGSYHYY